MDEPSLLDYLKARLNPRHWGNRISTGTETEPVKEEKSSALIVKPRTRLFQSIPWESILAVTLALLAQRCLEPGTRSITLAVLLYTASLGLLILAVIKGAMCISSLMPGEDGFESLSVKKPLLLIFIPLLVLTFYSFSGNRFTIFNLILWVATFLVGLMAFWTSARKVEPSRLFDGVKEFIRNPVLHISINWWEVLLLAAFLVAAFFRLYSLDNVPNEMISDHAEKLLDVNDVLNGQAPIFFFRNTGREAFQLYLTALVSKIFSTGVSFLSLKLGTALMGLVTLIYVFRLGKELGGKWVGLLALTLMGIAYWPNVISRIGLRFTLYPLFVAPLMFYLFRGLRRMDKNDFILAGIALGLGLHGYSPFRITPFLVGAVLLVYLLSTRQLQQRKTAVYGFLLVALFSLVVFLPLARFWTEEPAWFGYRAFSRLGSSERPLPGPVLQIFFTNFWKASIMPFWSNGTVWAHSVAIRPALDVVSAAFYMLGIFLLLFRYLRTRSWQDLGLLLSIPILMMPSILSLAFPEENPSLNRTAGAAVPIFIVCAIALHGFLQGLWMRAKGTIGKVLSVAVGLVLVLLSARQNFNLVFHQYAMVYAQSSWNTSEIGAVVRDYINSTGSVDSVWVVGMPHWVDTRNVGINSGFPAEDYAIWPEDFGITLQVPAPKLFILRFDDQADIDLLTDLYPDGYLILHEAASSGTDFYSFVVPPSRIVDELVN